MRGRRVRTNDGNLHCCDRSGLGVARLQGLPWASAPAYWKRTITAERGHCRVLTIRCMLCGLAWTSASE
eukprot:109777-Prymnesium_polylepis.2